MLTLRPPSGSKLSGFTETTNGRRSNMVYRITTGRNAIKRAATLTAAMAMLSLPATDVLAQESQRVFFAASAENTKYTQQHLIEVGDVPGHHVRLFEIRRTFPNDPPIIGGLALKEEWFRGTSDYTDNNGPRASTAFTCWKTATSSSPIRPPYRGRPAQASRLSRSDVSPAAQENSRTCEARFTRCARPTLQPESTRGRPRSNTSSSPKGTQRKQTPRRTHRGRRLPDLAAIDRVCPNRCRRRVVGRLSARPTVVALSP